MATSGEEASSSVPDVPTTESTASSKEDPPPAVETASDGFDQFYSEVKEIEKRDSTLTSSQQLDRLTRPGATYFNLNPYDVLQVDHDASLSEIKQKYRRMSILVHPDKNQNDQERAEKAFEAVNKSWKTLENEEGYRRCQEIIEEAKTRTDALVKQKKKQLKKEGKPIDVPEDHETQYKHAVYVQTCKLFADLERYRREKEAKEMHERKRKAEEEIQEEENKKKQNEWKKNYEESRTGRVNSWRDWKKGSKKKSGSLKPPKLKAEKR